MSALETILAKWAKAKEKSDALEAKIQKYKVSVAKMMNEQGVDKLKAGKYSVTRRRNTRTSVSKEQLPPEIWQKYSTRISYDSFVLNCS